MNKLDSDTHTHTRKKKKNIIAQIDGEGEKNLVEKKRKNDVM